MSEGLIRVLVVDDSAVVRAVLARILDDAPGVEVAGMALDGVVAQRKTLKLRPDVITLDVDMPRMDGFAFLEWLGKESPTPTVVVSGATTERGQDLVLDLIQAGATDVVLKPNGKQGDLEEVSRCLIEKVRAAARTRPWSRKKRFAKPSPEPALDSGTRSSAKGGAFASLDLVAIGASTGGPMALTAVLERLPATCPPVLVVQHMPADFIPRLAARLNSVCAVDVAVATQGARLRQGQVLFAPGGAHLGVRRQGAHGYRAVLQGGPKRNHQLPAADVLFEHAAHAAGSRACGVLLTGMGRDGATGLLAMREAGAHTIVQDEATSVVFGMGGEAIRLGAAGSVLPLRRIARGILQPAPGAQRVLGRAP